MSSRIKNTYDFNASKDTLGKGGMAKVYLGEHKILQTKVAIKVLNDELLHNKDIRRRFIDEARKLAHLKHANLIVVKDVEDDQDFCAFVMEYVPGPTISQAIKNGRLTDESIAQFMSQLLHVCLYIHSKGIIHRDIKPSNVIIGPHGQLKLVDFGIAKDIANSDGTRTVHIMGTPSYMSPEQIKSTSKVTAQSDIWSLGILLWEMVSGKNIFNTNQLSIPEIQSKILYELIPSTGTKWDKLILKATEKDLSLRYLNCKEMLDDLLIVVQDDFTLHSDNDEEETEVDLPPPTLTIKNKKKSYVFLGLAAIAVICVMAYFFIGADNSSLENQPTGIIDADNNLYDTVKIGSQVWTTTNYKCTALKDGSVMQEATTEEEWENAARNEQPAWCYHEDWNSSDKIYGKLYNWYAVKHLVVPEGFQIATATDWDVLHDFIGKNSTSGLKLIAGDNWDSGQIGDNLIGFGAIPTGYRNENNKFADVSRTGVWWTSSMFTDDVAIGYAIADTELKRTNYLMKCGFSIRLVKTSVKKYKLGDRAFGGYVFQLNEDETSGKICTMNAYNSPRNMEDALFFCGQLIIEGYNGWYLPSIDELNSMYLLPEIRKTFSIDEYYWSSTNLDPNSAYWYSFAYGKYYAKDINEKGYVRPIRKF
jgi:uncharacterized protein (TIGR02145 family)